MLCPWENRNRTEKSVRLGGGHMEVTTVNGRQVVECPHCNGTSVCQFGTIVKRIDLDKPLSEAAKQHGIAYCRSEEHTSELQSRQYLVCRLLLEKKQHRQREHDFATYAISLLGASPH